MAIWWFWSVLFVLAVALASAWQSDQSGRKLAVRELVRSVAVLDPTAFDDRTDRTPSDRRTREARRDDVLRALDMARADLKRLRAIPAEAEEIRAATFGHPAFTSGWLTVQAPILVDGKPVGLVRAEMLRTDWGQRVAFRAVAGGFAAGSALFFAWMIVQLQALRRQGPPRLGASSRPIDRSVEEAQTALRRSVAAASAMLAVSLALLVAIGDGLRRFEESFHGAYVRDFRLHQLAEEILRYDEILTGSSWIGATTGRKEWFERYDRYVDRLDEALREAQALDADQTAWFLTETSRANERLIAIETESRRLAERGQIAEAVAALDQPGYHDQKERYQAGVTRFEHSLKQRVESTVTHFHHQISVALVGIAIVLLAIVANAVYLRSAIRRMSEAQATIRRALVVAQDELGERVRERTDALERQRSHLKATFDAMAEAVIGTDSDGRVVEMNPVAERMTGWNLDEARGRRVEDVVDLRTALGGRPLPDPVRAVLDRGTPEAAARDAVVIDRNGRSLSVAGQAAPVRNFRGEVVGAVLVLRDITVERQQEAAVREARADLDAVLAGTHTGVWNWDPVGDRWTVDLERPGPLGPMIVRGGAAIHPDDRTRLDPWTVPGPPGSTLMVDVRILDGGESGRWVRLRGVGEPGAEGGRRWRGTAVDVDENVRTEAALRASEATFRQLFEGSGDPVLLIRGGVFIDANSAARRALGMDEATELAGQPPHAFSPPTQPDGSDSSSLADRMVAIAEREGFHRFEWLHRRMDGTLFPVEVMLTSLILDGEPTLHVVWRDIGHRLAVEQALLAQSEQLTEANSQLTDLATLDALTGLANRRTFLQVLEAVEGTQPAVVLLVDIDDFKRVNVSFGNGVGDHLLIAIAHRLGEQFRAPDVVARIGGDEFAVLLRGVAGTEAAASAARRLTSAFEAPFDCDGASLVATISVGAALLEPGDDPDAVLQRSETAMRRVKAAGKAHTQVFEPWMAESEGRRLILESAMREAWQRRAFTLQYQPIVCLETGLAHHAEALLRWRDEALGPVSPAEFVPILEATGLIVPVGRWVLEEACRRLQAWRSSDDPRSGLGIAVNLSAVQIGGEDFVDDVLSVVRAYPVEPSWLTLEVTETAFMADPTGAAAKLSALRGHGFQVAIDDFGAGYSSLGALAQLPADIVKVDRTLVTPVGAHLESTAILRAIATMCRALLVSVVVEGIENEDQWIQSRELGCRYGQGYLFSRPLDEANLADWLGRDQRSAA